MCLLMIGTVSQVSDVTHGPLFIHFSRLLIMYREYREWLFFIMFCVLLLPPVGITSGETSAIKDDSDPKPENTGKIDTSRDGPNPLNLRDDSGKLLTGPVDNIPQNEMEFLTEQTKDRGCNPGQKAMYVLHPQKKETYIGCYKDKVIHGYYPEFNARGVQPKYNASCYLCNASYYASEGYRFRKCFEFYGGISSPNCMCTCTTHSDETLTTVFIILLIVLCVVLISSFLYIFCIRFCIRKHSYENNIDNRIYFKEAHRALETCRMQITRGPNNEREEADS